MAKAYCNICRRIRILKYVGSDETGYPFYRCGYCGAGMRELDI